MSNLILFVIEYANFLQVAPVQVQTRRPAANLIF